MRAGVAARGRGLLQRRELGAMVRTEFRGAEAARAECRARARREHGVVGGRAAAQALQVRRAASLERVASARLGAMLVQILVRQVRESLLLLQLL